MSGTRRIMIVEDEPNVRLVFRTALESNDYTLSTAEDGEIALKLLKPGAADLVLLDLQMPGIGGMEVLRRLRESGNDVPVVIVTAHGTIPDAVAAMKLGAVDFLSKPVTPDALRKVVSNVLARTAAAPKPTGKAKEPENPAAEALRLAKHALNRRSFDEADRALHKAIDLNPRCAEAHYLVGVLHELRDERHAAYTAYRASLKADPNYEPAKMHLMKYYNDRML
jgi:DNA-binding NtrC family response regulator